MSKRNERQKRWQLKNPEKWRAIYIRSNNRGKGHDHNSGELYTEAEIEEILAISVEKQTLNDVALAKKLGRTTASIQTKRSTEKAKRGSGRVVERNPKRAATLKLAASPMADKKEEAPAPPVKDNKGRLLIVCRELDSE